MIANVDRAGIVAPRDPPDHHARKQIDMKHRPAGVVCVGEATVELVRGGDARFGLACAGDAFNVSVYLARAGIATKLATALGEDPPNVSG